MLVETFFFFNEIGILFIGDTNYTLFILKVNQDV